jgi:hypothetical protein
MTTRASDRLFRPFSVDDTELFVWVERDRAHVELCNASNSKTIIEFWDEAVSEAIEDGIIPPVDARGTGRATRDVHVALYNYALDQGLLSKQAERA